MAFSHSPKIVTDGLVLCLDAANPKSYPGTGTTWKDLSGNGNNATLYNGTAYNVNGYFELDGVNDYISISSIDLSTTPSITLQVLFQPQTYPSSGTVKLIAELSNNFNSYNDTFVASYNDNSVGQSYECFVSVRGNSGYNLDAWSKDLLNNLEWNFWTPTMDMSITGGKEVSLYQNGILRNSLGISSYNNDNTGNFGNRPLYIGCRGGSQLFADYYLSSIVLYNRALTASEIQQNYNALKGRFGL